MISIFPEDSSSRLLCLAPPPSPRTLMPPLCTPSHRCARAPARLYAPAQARWSSARRRAAAPVLRVSSTRPRRPAAPLHAAAPVLWVGPTHPRRPARSHAPTPQLPPDASSLRRRPWPRVRCCRRSAHRCKRAPAQPCVCTPAPTSSLRHRPRSRVRCYRRSARQPARHPARPNACTPPPSDTAPVAATTLCAAAPKPRLDPARARPWNLLSLSLAFLCSVSPSFALVPPFW